MTMNYHQQMPQPLGWQLTEYNENSKARNLHAKFFLRLVLGAFIICAGVSA